MADFKPEEKPKLEPNEKPTQDQKPDVQPDHIWEDDRDQSKEEK